MQAGKHPQAVATKVLRPRCAGLIERPRLLELVTHRFPTSSIKHPQDCDPGELRPPIAAGDEAAVAGWSLKSGPGEQDRVTRMPGVDRGRDARVAWQDRPMRSRRSQAPSRTRASSG